jgi:hypothetical protein
MKFLTQGVLLLSAAFLNACGGGGSSTPTPTPVTVISQSEASSALSLAKNGTTLLAVDVLSRVIDADVLRFLTQPGGQTGSTPSASSSSACGLSGTFSLVYKKTTASAGLSAGDYYTVSFNNCAYSGKPTLSGSLKISALTTTTTDISLSSLSTFSLPLSMELTNYKETATGLTQTYSGTIAFSTFSAGQSGSGSVALVSAPNISVVRTTPSGTITTNYSNASYNVNIPSSGSPSSQASYNLYAAVGTAAPITMTVATNITGNIAAPTTSNIVVTNYLGGKITGNMPSGSSSVNVSVDNGNDGTIDSGFTVLYSAL